MRHLTLLLIGVVIGASCALAAAQAIQKRGAYRLGVMAAMQHHLNRLREDLASPSCTPATARARIERIAALAPEIDSAFADSAASAGFATQVADFRAAIERTLAGAASDCRAVESAWRELADACDACHAHHR